MARLFLLAAALGLSGCLFNDCSFDIEELSGNGTIQADAAMVGDTLTVVFVDTYDPGLDVFVRAGLDANLSPSADGVVRLGVEIESLVYQNSAPRPFGTATVGDTVYVYIAGSLDPAVFSQVCSPPQEYIRLDVTYIEAPANVRAIRTSRIGPEDLPAPAARILLQRDAHRPTSV